MNIKLTYQLTLSCYCFSSLITAKSGNSESWRISLSLTCQSVFITRNAKTLGFHHVQPSDVGPGSGSLERKSVLLLARNELFIWHDVFSDGQSASSIKEQSLLCLVSGQPMARMSKMARGLQCCLNYFLFLPTIISLLWRILYILYIYMTA
jgi:hypothetical protein